MCINICQVCAAAIRGQKKPEIPWSWRYRWVWWLTGGTCTWALWKSRACSSLPPHRKLLQILFSKWHSQFAVLLSSSLYTPGIIYVFYESEIRWHLTREEILPPGPMILSQICMDYTNFSSSPGDYTTGKQKFRNSITWWRRQSKPLCGEW